MIKFLLQPSTPDEQIKYFGIVMAINYMLYYVVWTLVSPAAEEDFTLRLIAFLGCVVLALNQRIVERKYLSIIWYITITYCLPFFFTYMTLKNHLSVVWLMNDVTALFFLCILLNIKETLTCFSLGFSAACLTFMVQQHLFYIQLGTINVYELLWTFFAPFVLGIIFLDKKNTLEKEKLSSMKALGGTIAHELRTPLLAISAAVKNIVDSMGPLLQAHEQGVKANVVQQPLSKKNLEKLPKALELIQLESRHAFNIIDMTLTKLKENAVPTTLEKCSAKQCIEEAISRYPFTSQERSCVQLNLEKDFSFEAEQLLIVHVLFNLLKNALFHIQKADKGHVEIWLTLGEKTNTLHFKDTSTGIAKKNLTSIFSRFYSKSDQGTGLGLAFCQSVMQGLGGDIACDSVLGQYTHFMLKFPVIANCVGEKS